MAAARFKVGPLPSFQVRAAQLSLIYLGYSPGEVDGWFGSKTQAVLIKFQKSEGLPTTGLLDEASLTALREKAMTPV
jgi:peptidoglycan hydrolase-like protein with peptidoglycan-binding domain